MARKESIVQQPESQSEQCLPFEMNPIQISILQNIANGKTDKEYVKEGKISKKSLNYFKANLGWVGLPDNERSTPVPMKLLVPALIQDGINQGYLEPPKLPDTPIEITKSNEIILRFICNGETSLSLTRKYGSEVGWAYESIRKAVKMVRDKFGAKNNNHLIALYTACKKNNLVEII